MMEGNAEGYRRRKQMKGEMKVENIICMVTQRNGRQVTPLNV